MGGEIVQNKQNGKNKLPVWAIILIIFWVIVIFGIIFSFNGTDSKGNTNTNNKTNSSTTTKEKYQLDKSFKYDDLEITIGSKIEFVTVNN
jgi:hypothetical protein